MHVYTVLYSSAENEVSIDFWRQEGSKFEDGLNRGLNEAALFYYRFRNTLTVLVCKYILLFLFLAQLNKIYIAKRQYLLVSSAS